MFRSLMLFCTSTTPPPYLFQWSVSYTPGRREKHCESKVSRLGTQHSLVLFFTPQVTHVHRVAVGVGRNIKLSELEVITGDKNQVIMVENFRTLNNHLDNIRQIANGESSL